MRLAFPGLMAALSEGATVVAPTPLLASVALEQYNRAQIGADRSGWERPKIAHIGEWMTACWQQARFAVTRAPLLLSLPQERELWRQIIEQDRPALFDISAMAGLAQRAFALMAEYQISSTGEAWSQSPDAEAFLRWRNTFNQRLRSENWIARAGLWSLLPEWLANGSVTPGRVVFAPLTSVSPGLMRLQREVGGMAMSPVASVASASNFESLAQEFEHAARVARHLIEAQGIRSVGVLVCDLPSHASEVERIFNDVFYPSTGAGNHLHTRSQPLLSHPLIANALLLLELAKPRIGHASAAAILRSPFIDGAVKERSGRALAAARLARGRELDFALADIENVAKPCPAFQTFLSRLNKVLAGVSPRMPFSNWSHLFSKILEAAKWPAIAPFTESEQHAANAWNDGLSELASLALVSSDARLPDAVARLRGILGRPSDHGNWNSPVQVLDAAACEGIEFQHTLILNATEEAWPPSASLSPLIPYALQRAQRVPGSHREEVMEDQARRTRSLCASAPQVKLSFAGSLAPLFRPYVAIATEASFQVYTGLTAAQAHPPAALENQPDDFAPPLTQTDTFRGGAGVIRSQSQCPFKAFAEYRLLARGDDEACFGFNALERGTFIHKALEIIWLRLQTQSALNSMPAAELEDLIQTSVAEALGEGESGPIYQLTASAERQRLARVLTDWLFIERSRPMPFSVEQMEQKRPVELAGLKLELRIDRIDRLADGGLVLIDYKSGQQSKTQLEGQRPNEPQLLVYAAALEEPVEGLYFAEVRNRESRAVGHAEGKHFEKRSAIKEHKIGWRNFLQEGTNNVYRLAGEFKDGNSAVNPKPGACAYCKVKPLCRIGTNDAPSEEEE